MGHEDAVLSLAYNTLNRNVLASGSADKRIIIWDLEELKEAVKIKNHKNSVQSLKFHPIESFSLLSGSSDKTVALFDCRNPNENKKTWKLKNNIEQVTWNHFKPNNFLCSDDEGFVYIYDIRNENPLSSFKAHSDESAVIGLALSSFVPNLLVTACEDEVVKIWDIENDTFEFIFEKKLKLVIISIYFLILFKNSSFKFFIK
jgi:periodic tryptophan protein 1